jgi:4-alpha-glucanotransferase
VGARGRDAHWAFVRAVQASVARTAIVPVQDVLGLGSEARLNTPARAEGNWSWRLGEGALTRRLADRLRELCRLYGR